MTNIDVSFFDNGPIKITGASGLTLKDATGKAYGLGGRDKIALCRCGGSAKKPFCDGSHRMNGFQSKCEAHELPPPEPKLG